MQREPEDEEALSRSLWGKPTLLFPGMQGLQIRTCSTQGDGPEPLTILGERSVVSRVGSVQAPSVALGTHCCLQMCLQGCEAGKSQPVALRICAWLSWGREGQGPPGMGL